MHTSLHNSCASWKFRCTHAHSIGTTAAIKKPALSGLFVGVAVAPLVQNLLRTTLHLRLALSGTRRGFAQSADIVLRQFECMRDELAVALATRSQRHHASIDEFDQAPGARYRQ